MGKRKSAVLIDSDESRSSSSDSDSDIDKDMLSLSKKKGAGAADKKVKIEKLEAFSSSSSSESGSDYSSSQKGKKAKRKPAKRARRSTSGTTKSSVSSGDDDSGEESPTNDVTSSVPPTSAATASPNFSSVVSSTVRNNDLKEQTPSDLEEGEVSDDEDPDRESSGEEFTDGYDDNLMGDEEDQRRLNAMTEKEREQEIYKRIELRDILRRRFELERKLKRKNKLLAKVAARGKPVEPSSSVDDAEEPEEEGEDAFPIDAKVRSQERKKTVDAKTDKKTQAMDALKASRELKNQRAQEKEKMRQEQEKKREEKEADDDDLEFRKDDDTSSSVADKKNKKLKASDVYSDDSASDSDDDTSNNQHKERRKSASSSSSGSDSDDEERNRKPQYVDKVEDLNRIRISRFKIERWLYLPFFAKLLKGCYVRVGVGTGIHKSTYKICEIVDVVETSKIYDLGSLRTNKGLKVKLSGDTKVFRFEYVSNQVFSEEDFIKWKDLTELHKEELPTLDQIEKKEKEFKDAFNYQLQEEDIEAIITEKAKFKNSPVNFAARKTELMKEREIAIMNGNDDKALRLKREIQELDDRANVLDKVRTSSISSISYINERNRKRNVEEAEKAILEELKSNKGKKVEDPFTRRNTKPRIVSKPNAMMNGNGSENLPGLSIPKLENGTDVEKPLQETQILSLDAVDGSDASMDVIAPSDDQDSKSEDQLAVGDLFSAHDFDIKLDLDAKLPPNLPIVARPSMTPVKETAPRRSLNLEEYKRKKGLI